MWDGSDGEVSAVKTGSSEEVTWSRNLNKILGAIGRGGTLPVRCGAATIP